MVAAKKKTARRKRPTMAALIAAGVIRAALVNAAAESEDAYVVLRFADTQTAEAVHWGSRDECGLWLAQAPSGWHYLLLNIKDAKGVTK
jgi:hypothetical protein